MNKVCVHVKEKGKISNKKWAGASFTTPTTSLAQVRSAKYATLNE